jgi:hypothetical protein
VAASQERLSSMELVRFLPFSCVCLPTSPPTMIARDALYERQQRSILTQVTGYF